MTAQAEEVGALSTKMTAHTTEPAKAHVTRSMDELRKVNCTSWGSDTADAGPSH